MRFSHQLQIAGVNNMYHMSRCEGKEVAVADRGSSQVVIFNQDDGKIIRKFSSVSRSPFGVAYSKKLGHFFVACYNGICVFKTDGSHVNTFQSGTGWTYQGVCLNSAETEMYVTSNQGQIQVLDMNGRVLRSIASTAYGICISKQGRVFAAEYNSNRVAVIEAGASSVSRYIQHGSFSQVYAVCLDQCDNMVVANGNGEINVFDQDGKHLKQINGAGQNGVANIYGLGFLDEGLLLATDYSGKKVNFFK